MNRRGMQTAIVVCLTVTIGCRSKDDSLARPKAPRPVSVIALAESDPGRFQRVTGTVASWKTDQLGFEVDGRVQFVIEPETNVAGQVYDDNGNLITEGTLLARLDSTRYTLGVVSAKAQVAMAEKQREAAQTEFDRVIPAQEEAATALRDLAQIEVERNTELVAESAAPVRALDLATAKLRESAASLIQLAATKEAKASEVASIEAKIRELQEAQKQAERDVADCRLYSSFAGQVADVHVVPGSYARQGQAVVTMQMMDPIKVEIEVAAQTARSLNHRDQVNIYVPGPNDESMRQVAFVYIIDPVADPQTRTFTVTLMMRNERVGVPVPDQLDVQTIARCSLIGKMFTNVAGFGEHSFINEVMLQEDVEGFFFWKILNRRIGTLSSGTDRLLDVEKVRVVPGDIRFSMLGVATVRDITLSGDDTEFDPATDMIAGNVVPPAGDKPWDGDKLLYDVQRWLVRPGDLVGVDQSGDDTPSGIYVPLDTIMEKGGSKYVFAVAEASDGDTARRVEVTIQESVGTLRRIEPVEKQSLPIGTKIVAEGAAFLVDGERINVARVIEPSAK